MSKRRKCEEVTNINSNYMPSVRNQIKKKSEIQLYL